MFYKNDMLYSMFGFKYADGHFTNFLGGCGTWFYLRDEIVCNVCFPSLICTHLDLWKTIKYVSANLSLVLKLFTGKDCFQPCAYYIGYRTKYTFLMSCAKD